MRQKKNKPIDTKSELYEELDVIESSLKDTLEKVESKQASMTYVTEPKKRPPEVKVEDAYLSLEDAVDTGSLEDDLASLNLPDFDPTELILPAEEPVVEAPVVNIPAPTPSVVKESTPAVELPKVTPTPVTKTADDALLYENTPILAEKVKALDEKLNNEALKASYEKQIEELKAQLAQSANAERLRKEMEITLNSLKGEMKVLQEGFNTANKKHKEDLTKSVATIEALKKEVSSKDKRIDSLAKEKDAQDKKVAEINVMVDNLETKMKSDKENLAKEYDQKLKQAKADVKKSADEKIAALNNEKAQFETKAKQAVEKLNAENASLQEAAQSVKTKYKELFDRYIATVDFLVKRNLTSEEVLEREKVRFSVK